MISAAIPTEALQELAEANGVCTRPVVHEVTDTVTGQVRMVSTRCGATLASKCVPCARRNRVLRMQQCREGWHLEEEPVAQAPDDPPRRRPNRTRKSRRAGAAGPPAAARTRLTCPASRSSSARSGLPSPPPRARPTDRRCS